jgi:hypothetical protein
MILPKAALIHSGSCRECRIDHAGAGMVKAVAHAPMRHKAGAEKIRE